MIFLTSYDIPLVTTIHFNDFLRKNKMDMNVLMYYMHNSNSSKPVQVTLEGIPLEDDVIWVCLGVFSAEKLGIINNSWSVELDNNILNFII